MHFRIIILIAVVCGLFLIAPTAYAETGTCSCSGTISVKSSVFTSTFDSYCPQVADYCSSCGGGRAICSMDFTESRATCEGLNTDLAGYMRSLGIPEIAITQLNFDGSCTFAASRATETPSTASTKSAKSTGYTGKLLPSCIKSGGCSVAEMVSVIGNAAQILLGLVGSVTLLLFIYGGFVWLTSGGKPDRIEKGKTILVQTVIGLIIVFGAYAGVHFLIKALGAKIPEVSPPVAEEAVEKEEKLMSCDCECRDFAGRPKDEWAMQGFFTYDESQETREQATQRECKENICKDYPYFRAVNCKEQK